MTEAMKEYLGIRPATAEEIEIYERVDAMMVAMPDDEFDTVLDIVNEFAFAYGAERRKAYNKIYRLAKKLALTVKELETWYWVEE